jgi:hypothetical protein
MLRAVVSWAEVSQSISVVHPVGRKRRNVSWVFVLQRGRNRGARLGGRTLLRCRFKTERVATVCICYIDDVFGNVLEDESRCCVCSGVDGCGCFLPGRVDGFVEVWVDFTACGSVIVAGIVGLAMGRFFDGMVDR